MKWKPHELILSDILEKYDETLMEFLGKRLKCLKVLSIKQSMVCKFLMSLDEDIVMPAVENVYCDGIEQNRTDFTEANQRIFSMFYNFIYFKLRALESLIRHLLKLRF